MASDMSGLIDKLGPGKVNVVGWSDGVNIGLELAYAHPEIETVTLSPDTARLPVIRKKLEDLMIYYPNFTPGQLRTIDVPFLIIAGDHDAITLDQTVTLYNNLPKAELFIVPHASHFAPIENPDLINSEIIRFLKAPYTDIDRYYFFKLME